MQSEPLSMLQTKHFQVFPPKVTNEQLTLNLYDHFCEFWALVPKERLNESYF